jgi:hypothetical protein
MSLEQIANLAADPQTEPEALRGELALYFYQNHAPEVVAKTAAGVVADKLTANGPADPGTTVAAVENVSSFLEQLQGDLKYQWGSTSEKELEKLNASAAGHYLDKLSVDEMAVKVDVPEYTEPRGIVGRLDHLLHLERDNEKKGVHEEAFMKDYYRPTGGGEAFDLASNYTRVFVNLINEHNVPKSEALDIVTQLDLGAPGHSQNREVVREVLEEMAEAIADKRDRLSIGLHEASEKVDPEKLDSYKQTPSGIATAQKAMDYETVKTFAKDMPGLSVKVAEKMSERNSDHYTLDKGHEAESSGHRV